MGIGSAIKVYCKNTSIFKSSELMFPIAVRPSNYSSSTSCLVKLCLHIFPVIFIQKVYILLNLLDLSQSWNFLLYFLFHPIVLQR